jgi:hypothetical protein
VTVRAEQPEVLDPVVSILAIDVMEFKGERSAAPFGQTAFRARVCEEPDAEEPPLEGTAIPVRAVLDEHLVERARRDDWSGSPLAPTLPAEVRAIQTQSSDSSTDSGVVPSYGLQPQLPQHLRDAAALTDGGA